MKFLSCLAAAAITSAVAAERTRCGNRPPPDELRVDLNGVARRGIYRNATTRSVDVYVHVITSEDDEGLYTDDQIASQVRLLTAISVGVEFKLTLTSQIDVMNESYAPSGISFNLLETDYTVNNDWASITQDSQEEYDMKSSLRKGTYGNLNIYFTEDLISSTGDELLGFCPFPVGAPSDDQLTLDGCTILAASMPGGTEENFDLGLTVVHEVGHWFGLFHVFEGFACSGPGDQVNDTPLQQEMTSGCPTSQDSCPDAPGTDSIHNYMDYSYDACLTEFTQNQGVRMFSIYDANRAGK